MESTVFRNLDCVKIQNQSIELIVSKQVGIRILSLRLRNGKNLFAELPEFRLEHPSRKGVNLLGGHRLWHAPQCVERTHLPDDQPVEIHPSKQGIEIVQPTEPQTGIQKKIKISLPDNSPSLVVEHSLKNNGLWNVETALWAITMLKPGGVAILPQNTHKTDKAGVVPNRNIVLWPFTNIASPNILWGNQYILVKTNLHNEQMKLGYANFRQWLAYHIDNTLFVKKASFYPEKEYFDMLSSSHFYAQDEFSELETLSHKQVICPGSEITHTEEWHIAGEIALQASENEVKQQIEPIIGKFNAE